MKTSHRDGWQKRGQGHAYEAAPIAARFEECLQCFERLSSIIETDQEAETVIYPTIEGAFSRFRQWGTDTGAPSRALDHALRNASQLRQTTENLLGDLLSALQSSKPPVIHNGLSDFVQEITRLRWHCVVVSTAHFAEISGLPSSELDLALDVHSNGVS